VLLVEETARSIVQPLYVSAGLAWEPAERAMLARFLEATATGDRTRPLVSLNVDMRDVYPASHWAVTGRPPGYHTADEEVYLHGRNIVLFGKAAVFCAGAKIERLLAGTLDHNPFPDATPEFRSAMATALSLGLAHPIAIEAPYAQSSKAAVIERGHALGLPLHLTISCMNPEWSGAKDTLPRHCGICSKCRERHNAFVDAGVRDTTDYADRRYIDVRIKN
jgi:7-cyano-7-deazaguanine synthase